MDVGAMLVLSFSRRLQTNLSIASVQNSQSRVDLHLVSGVEVLFGDEREEVAIAANKVKADDSIGALQT